MKTALQHNNIR